MIVPYRLRNASGQDKYVEKDETPISQPLADNMRKLRGERSIGVLRQEMLDRKIHVGTSTLHRADKGELGIRVESLEKIGQFFDVTAAQLLQPDLGAGTWPLSGLITPTEWSRLPVPVREDALRSASIPIDRHRRESESGESSRSRPGAGRNAG